MSEPLFAKGTNGQISFDGQFVTLHRKGFRARTTVGKGDKRIPVHSITAVQWKPPGPLMPGYIQFSLGGGNERRSAFGSQSASAKHDENSVTFVKKEAPPFEAIRDAVETAVLTAHSPQPARVVESDADQIAKLAALRDQGILTDDEFTAKKKQILGSL